MRIMHKKQISFAIGFISWVNIAFPCPSFSSEVNQIGSTPVYKEILSPYDKRSGWLCPDDKAYAIQFLTPSGRPEFTERASDRLLAWGLDEYDVSKVDEVWDAKLYPADLNKTIETLTTSPSLYHFLRRYSFDVKLLVSNSSTSYTEDQLVMILDKYKLQQVFPDTVYEMDRIDYDPLIPAIILKNSVGKEVKLFFGGMSPPDYMEAGGKRWRPVTPFNIKALFCTANDGLHIRSVSILNDRGANPGEILEYPAMVLVVDVFMNDTLEVRSQPAVSF